MESKFSINYHLTGGETGPEGEMPLALLAARIIEIATLHADSLGVGYKAMISDDQAWVLSRLSIEMERYPKIDEDYSIATWVETFNRRFSERNFEIFDAEGHTIGYARSMWAAINLKTRGFGSLDVVSAISDVVIDRACPIEKTPRLTDPETADKSLAYTFTYRDLDFNRHVNSVAYIRLLLDAWPLDFHDRYRAKRIDVAYIHEARFGDTVELRCCDDGGATSAVILKPGDEPIPVTRMKISWEKR